MITTKREFLSQKLLTDITSYAKDSISTNKWRTNLSWDENIVKGAGQVSILSLAEFEPDIKRRYLEIIPHLEQLHFGANFYIWQRGSHIPWHNDGKYELGSTIYLNKTWNIDDGGLFLWKDEESQIHGEIPEYNKAILNSNKILHAVSMISNQAENLRTTIQVFAFQR